MDPVGATEIAWRVGVGRPAVERWQQRHPDFPQPQWTVGGRPAWDWSDIERWLIDTNRLPGARAPLPRWPWVTVRAAALPRADSGVWALAVEVDGELIWRTRPLGYGQHDVTLVTAVDVDGPAALLAAQHALTEVAVQAETVTATIGYDEPHVDWLKLLRIPDSVANGHVWQIGECHGWDCRVGQTKVTSAACELRVDGRVDHALPTRMLRSVAGWRGGVRREAV